MLEKIKKYSKNLYFEELSLNEDKQFFCDIVNKLKTQFNINVELLVNIGMDLTYYNELYFDIIDQLLEQKYGQFKTDIIYWFINFGFDEEGNPLPFQTNIDNQGLKTFYIKTPEELYDILQILPQQGTIQFFDPEEEDNNEGEDED